MNNTLTNTMSKIPGIGDIPILGLLFKSKAHQKNQTELVVMITPSIIKKGQMGVSEGLPSLVEPYLKRPDKTYPNPDPYTGSPRYPADRPQPREGNGAPPQPRQGAAQQMPATLAGTPSARARAVAADFADCASDPARREAGCGCREHSSFVYTPNTAPAKAQTPASKESASVKAEVKEVDRAAQAAEQSEAQESSRPRKTGARLTG